MSQTSLPPGMTYPPVEMLPPRRSPLLGCLLGGSLLLNLLLFGVTFFACLAAALAPMSDLSTGGMQEVHHSGNAVGKDKIAVITLEGVILEGLNEFFHKQVIQAGKDPAVKAVVLRINSPGGSITGSDDIHRRLMELKNGNAEKNLAGKPHLVVSMGSLAASGGYYAAMPSSRIFAERTTMTGSIGVYASLPNIEGLAKTIGATMVTIKQGEIKDSGSAFKEMTAKEKLVWQDLVDQSYNLFLKVVEEGRPELKGKLLDKITLEALQAGPGEKVPNKTYQRYRADGGIFTAENAKKFGLVDEIGALDDAIAFAKKSANLGDEARVVRYAKPKTLTDFLLEMRWGAKPPSVSMEEVSAALMPRLWFLAPGCEMAGVAGALQIRH
ncbi:MAG: S49 family peptidase [Gemmataceae bacterium]|nr:S49 family peptidase [Gemmataceae bacterium]